MTSERTFNPSSDEVTILTLVNQERSRVGLAPLSLNPALSALARSKAHDILESHYWNHRSPRYGNHREMVKAAGIPSRATGENLAKARTVELAHARLLARDGYDDNMFLPFFTDIGVGVAKYPYGVVVCELFVAQ